jgi:undecaprenyl diphosphate synthase
VQTGQANNTATESVVSEQLSYKDQIDLEKLPRHIAIIMDGNGRWARQRGKPRTFGHSHGVTSVREAAESAAELGVEYLTLYAFSTENWNRPKLEVDALMSLLLQTINKETRTLNKNNIRLNAIGNLEVLPQAIRRRLQKTIDDTASNSRMTLTLALSYSSHWEITRAAQLLARDVAEGKLSPDEISCDLMSRKMSTYPMPDPELLIRTSGESRVSNFLLWQIAYAELFFSPKLWPDFRKEDLYEAIYNYQHRERRFGKTSEQLNGKVKG